MTDVLGQRWRVWQAVLAACAALAAAAAVLPGRTAAAVPCLACVAALAVGLVAGARSLRPHERRAWLPWIAGIGCSLAASTIWQAGVLLDRTSTVGDIASVLWIASYLPLCLAVLRIVEQRALTRAERNAVAKDVAVVTAAAAVLAWHLLIRPALAGIDPTGWGPVLTTFAFPLGDVVVLALGLRMMLVPGRISVCRRLIVLGLGALWVADTLRAFLPGVLPGSGTSWHLPSYLVIYAILTAAVLHPSRTVVTGPASQAGETRGMRGWRMMLLGTALCGVGLSAMVAEGDGWEPVPAGLAMIFMIAVILSRLHRAVADLEQAEQTLRHQATHDELTGVANRARLVAELSDALTRTPTLFFIDLDGFKTINDTRGHHCGDAVLKAVADRLSGMVRRSDIVARLGGDEFVVVCTGLPASVVPAFANRMEKELREPVTIGEHPVMIGASIGVISVPGATDLATDRAQDLIDDLLRTADDAMYQAKRGGGGVRIIEYALTA